MTHPARRTFPLCTFPMIALLLALALSPAALQAQTSDAAKPPAAETPAEATLRKLAAKGIIDGNDWSISLQLTQTGLGSVLDFLSEAARAKPRQINIAVDRPGIERAGIDLDRPIDLTMKSVSVREALDKVLGDDLGYVVTDSGLLIVTAKATMSAMIERLKTFPMLVRPTVAAAETLKKFNTGGAFERDGRQISLNLTATSLGSVLDFIHEMASTRQLQVLTDRAAIEKAGVDLDDPVDLTLRDVSFCEALRAALSAAPSLAAVILDDGAVLVTSLEAVRAMAQQVRPVAIADTPAAAATVAAISRYGPGAGDGAEFGLSHSASGVTVRQTLAEIAARIAMRDKEAVTLKVDVPSDPAAQALLDRKVSLHVKDWSVAEVLSAVLPPELRYGVEADGGVRITLMAKGQEALPAVATDAVARLNRTGTHDGEQWSVTLWFAGASLGNVLDFLAEASRAKPREVRIDVDREGIEAAGLNLDDPINLQVRDVSMHQALAMVLGPKCGYAVRRDGSILLTSRRRVDEMVAKGEAFSPKGPPEPWSVPGSAIPRPPVP